MATKKGAAAVVGKVVRAFQKGQKEDKQKTCVICYEDENTPGSFRAPPCGCYHCEKCLRHYYRIALHSVNFQEPRCCDGILPVEWAKELLAPRTWTTYRDRHEEAEEERSNHPAYRYCYRRSCGYYIPRRHRRVREAIGICACKGRTCLRCGHAEHTDRTCAEIIAEAKLARQREKDELRKGNPLPLTRKELEKMHCRYCPYCLDIIEKNAGCDHML